MNREQAARKKHHSGYSCSSAVYHAFSDLVQGDAPTPRSEGGKCGDLRRAGFLCNDLVGAAARMAEEGIGH